MIVKKSPAEIERMARSGLVLAEAHDLLAASLRAGVSTRELDIVADRFIRARGGVPTFKGYRGFPGSICASPNDMVVHGIPGDYRVGDGDLIALDVGVTLGGWVADAAITHAVGAVDADRERLLAGTREALDAGVEQCRVGNRMGDVSAAIQRTAEDAGLSIIRSLVGHGVGREMHEDPQVPNYGRPGTGPRLEAGVVIAVEPMTTLGSPEVRIADDGWAIYSQDGSAAAHFEFTVAITDEGPRILTPWHVPADERGAAAPAPAGA
ncbi:MAG TPA: type I methionyl aminopeptidase [Solirubrobacteraceae bacterium]|nr:type I methionyl aminopeptidase [Solirubrobacteraceae bacterium]